MFSPRINRRWMVATTVLGLGVGSAISLTALAQDHKLPKDPMSIAMSADEQKIASDHLAKLKAMADDPKQADELKQMIARVMVMQEMSKMMAEDPQFKSSAVAFMADPGVKKVHEEAKAMATNPEQMKKIEAEIAADPMAMKIVMHHAIMIANVPDKMMQAGDKK